MKIMKFGVLCALCSFSMLYFSACTKDSTPETVDEALEDSDWYVSYYYDKDHEETSNFDGYSFQFNADSSLVATYTGGTKTGTWYTSNSSDNNPKVLIAISGTERLDDIADDWQVDAFTADEIKLSDDSNNGELLYFKRK